MAQMARVTYNGTKKGEASKEMVRHMVCNSLRGYIRKFGNEYGKDLVLACDSANPWRREFFPLYKASRRQGREESTNDWDVLEEVFVKYLEDENLRFSVIENAWKKLNELFSFKVVRESLIKEYLT